MTPDDARHGTLAGFVAHSRANVPACRPCLDAKMRYEKSRLLHGPRKVSTLGTQRRIQALRALGYSLEQIANAGGWKVYGSLTYALNHDTITRATACRVAAIYDRLAMTPATGPKAHRMRLLAARQGWAPPLAWDDIDHDLAPAAAGPDDDVDQVLVDRILGGDWHLAPATRTAERHLITDRWLNTGCPWNALERLTGWNHGRYGRTRKTHREETAA